MLQISSFYLIDFPLVNLKPKSNLRHLLGQEPSSILSRGQNHSHLLFCKHSFMLLNYSQFLKTTLESLSSEITLHIHLTIIPSFISSHIHPPLLTTSPSLTSKVLLPYKITQFLYTKNLCLDAPLSVFLILLCKFYIASVYL